MSTQGDEERERLKQEYKEHYRRIKEAKERLKATEKKGKIAQALNNMDTGLNYGPGLITDLKIGINLIYIAFVLVLLVRYRKKLKDNFSSLEKRNLDWLQWFILGVVILAVIATTTNFLSTIYGADVLYTNINLLGITVYVYSIGYMGLRQPEFFAEFEDQVTKEKTEANVSYSKSGLDENTAKTMMEKLSEIMKNKKPAAKYRRLSESGDRVSELTQL